MRTSYVLRAREKSLSGTMHYFVVATRGSLSLFPDNSNAVAAGTLTCLVFGSIALFALYFLLNLMLPIYYTPIIMVPTTILVIYKSRSWIIMNAAQVKEKTLGMLSHELTVEAEGTGHILRFKSLRGTINSALRLASQDPRQD